MPVIDAMSNTELKFKFLHPTGESAAWCYTADNDKRFELCAVPQC